MFRRRTDTWNEKLVHHLISLVENHELYEDHFSTYRCHEAAIYSLADLLPDAPSHLAEGVAALLMRISSTHEDWGVRVAAIRALPTLRSYPDKAPLASSKQGKRPSAARRLDLSCVETGLKWLSVLAAVGFIGALVLTPLGIDRLGMLELRTTIAFLAITVGGSLFGWGGLAVFSIRRSMVHLQRLSLEECPFRDIVGDEVLRRFGRPGSAGFCVDLIRCGLYRYRYHCTCVRNY